MIWGIFRSIIAHQFRLDNQITIGWGSPITTKDWKKKEKWGKDLESKRMGVRMSILVSTNRLTSTTFLIYKVHYIIYECQWSPRVRSQNTLTRRRDLISTSPTFAAHCFAATFLLQLTSDWNSLSSNTFDLT